MRSLLAVLLAWPGILFATMTLGAGEGRTSDEELTLARLREERKRMAHRPRRIIFNNDGDDLLSTGATTPQGLLEQRTTALLGSHVDAIWYYAGGGLKLLLGDGAFGQLYGLPDDTTYVRRLRKFLAENDKDTLDVMIEACRTNNLEIFWSNRMNDTHDSFQPENLYNIKQKHPEYTLSTKAEGQKHSHPDVQSFWAAWDFEHDEIRQLTVDALREICRTYDIDGIELDFLRHPLYFRESMQQRPATPAHVALMTDMVRRIRSMTEDEGLRRGRPYLVAARAEADLELSRSVGLDVESWLKEELVDILVLGRFLESTPPTKSLIYLAHRHGARAYAQVGRSGYKESGRRGLEKTCNDADVMMYRGDAAVRFAEGADGVYMFNMFNPHDRLWHELGDRTKLATLDKTYVWDYLPSHRDNSNLLWGMRSRGHRPPVTLTDKGCERIPLFVGEDLTAASKTRARQSLALRVHLTGLKASHELTIEVNGNKLGDAKASPPADDQPKAVWLELPLDAELLKQGRNLVEAVVKQPLASASIVSIDQVRLDVRYDP
jgi:hypothetical protein